MSRYSDECRVILPSNSGHLKNVIRYDEVSHDSCLRANFSYKIW